MNSREVNSRAGLQCQYLSSVSSNATHLVDGDNGKLYVWRGTGADLPAAKTTCSSAVPGVGGVVFGPGLVVSYNSFTENQLVENYFTAQQGLKAYYMG